MRGRRMKMRVVAVDEVKITMMRGTTAWWRSSYYAASCSIRMIAVVMFQKGPIDQVRFGALAD